MNRSTECARPLAAPPNQTHAPTIDPYFDHSSDYSRRRAWEERPH